MQPQTLIPNLPQELLYPCITGSSSLVEHRALKIFLCSHVKGTCKNLYKQVDLCWQTCQQALSKDWNIDPMSLTCPFVYNWVRGVPKITDQTLYDMLTSSFSLEINGQDKEILMKPVIPRYLTSVHKSYMAFTQSRFQGDATIIDVKTKKLVGEISGNREKKVLLYHQNIQPIFYENGMFALFMSGGLRTLHYYAMSETGLSLQLKIDCPFSCIGSMYLLNDHIIFQTLDGLVSVSIKEFIHSEKFTYIQSKSIPGLICTLEVFDQKIVLFEEKSKNYLCVTTTIQNEKPEFRYKKLEVTELNRNVIHRLPRVFYHTLHFAFSLTFKDLNEYTVHAISKKELDSLDAPIRLLSYPQQGISKLCQFKDAVILCTIKMGDPLKFQTLNIVESQLTLTCLDIANANDYKFNRLDCIYAHLDRLFLIGVLTKNIEQGIPEPSNYLVIVNMETRSVENKYLLKLDFQPEIISIKPGSLYILNAGNQTIIEVKY